MTRIGHITLRESAKDGGYNHFVTWEDGTIDYNDPYFHPTPIFLGTKVTQKFDGLLPTIVIGE